MSESNKKFNNIIDKYIDDIISCSTPKEPLWNMEKILEGSVPRWNYIDACMIIGLINLYKHTGQKRFLEFADQFYDYYIFDDGTILEYKTESYNLDNICGGRVLFDLYEYTKKDKYKKAIEILYADLLRQPRTESGNFWHKLIYPNQIWLDGLYMAQVFYTRYETLINNCQNYDDIISQLKNVREFMFDPQKRLYYHGFDYSHEAFWADSRGLSKSFWLRSIGWFLMSLVDIFEYMSDTHEKEKDTVKQIFIEAVDGVLQYIDPKFKMFYQVVDCIGCQGNYLETSGSAMVAYAVLKGARLKILSQDYIITGIEIFEGICKKYLKSERGKIKLGGICLMAGLGPKENLKRDGSYEYYISEPVVQNDAKGLGPFLMSYGEIKYLENNKY
jgi:unsaturated rhamnogalacturonyl hydrolase